MLVCVEERERKRDRERERENRERKRHRSKRSMGLEFQDLGYNGKQSGK
jgi:hypothetical protein